MSATATRLRDSFPPRGKRPPRVAMVGAGQLARMTHQASISLGIELLALADSVDAPAVRAGCEYMLGSPDSLDDLRRLAEDCDVVTFDHEQVPPAHLEALEAEGFRLAPGRAAKLMAQDKLHARRTLHGLGYPVPDFAHATTTADIDAFSERFGLPIVAKAPRGGYDGRGIWTIANTDEAGQLLASVRGGLLLEPRLAITSELAVLVARTPQGERVTYPVAETIQSDAMCREILAPAEVLPEIAAEATRIATSIADDIEAVGVLAVEFFCTSGGLLVNELALRPHNSGHYTIEGCTTSQFEQHLRAVLGMPLGLPSLLAPAVATANVVGQDGTGNPASRLGRALAVPGAHVHLYGKATRIGRKLGHVTVCGHDPGPVRKAARLAASELEADYR